MEIVFHSIDRGDTVHGILINEHGSQNFQKHRQALLDAVHALNPQIRDIDRINAGEVIIVPAATLQMSNINVAGISPAERSEINTLRAEISGMNTKERSLSAHFTQDFFTSAGTNVGFGSADLLVSYARTKIKSSIPELKALIDNYEKYKLGNFSESAYYRNRKNIIGRYTEKLGVIDDILYHKKSASEVLRIDRRAGVSRTEKISNAIKLSKRVAGFTAIGNVALVGVSLHMACSDSAKAETQQRRNQILIQDSVTALAGVAIGTGALLAGVALAATPVGWVALMLVGVAAANGTGLAARKIYDTFGKEFDLASTSAVSSACGMLGAR